MPSKQKPTTGRAARLRVPKVRPSRYILVNGKPKPCHDIWEWARWFETARRWIAHTHVANVRVSTTFTGLNHGFGVPLLFETAVLGDSPADPYIERYATRAEAVAGHKRVVVMVRKAKAKR
jgi:hypothetical protein